MPEEQQFSREEKAILGCVTLVGGITFALFVAAVVIGFFLAIKNWG